MKLTAGPFDQMMRGFKTLEVRLYDEKRQKVDLNDQIIFSPANPNRQNSELKLHTEVKGILRYPTFLDLYNDVRWEWLGTLPIIVPSVLAESMYRIYSREDEKRYGVIGFRVQLYQITP